MKVDKMLKKIRKAIAKSPDVERCLVEQNSHSGKFKIGAKDKVAFRFFRDQLTGAAQKAVNLAYGTGGSMEVTYSDYEITMILYNENGKATYRLAFSEPADDINYALPA